jgi:hypothetical protein
MNITKNHTGAYNFDSQNFVPSRMGCVLRYCEEFKITTGGAGIIGYQEMRLNSVFDPNSTGAGHQPLGFDQLAAIYNRYVVKRCKYKVLSFYGATVGRIATCCINNSLTPTTISELVERYEADLRYIGDQTKMVREVELWKFNGVNFETYITDDRFSALITTNPSEIMNLIIAIDANNAAVTVYFTVEMEYEIDFFDPLEVAQS